MLDLLRMSLVMTTQSICLILQDHDTHFRVRSIDAQGQAQKSRPCLLVELCQELRLESTRH